MTMMMMMMMMMMKLMTVIKKEWISEICRGRKKRKILWTVNIIIDHKE
jgi:hypothetical protein